MSRMSHRDVPLHRRLPGRGMPGKDDQRHKTLAPPIASTVSVFTRLIRRRAQHRPASPVSCTRRASPAPSVLDVQLTVERSRLLWARVLGGRGQPTALLTRSSLPASVLLAPRCVPDSHARPPESPRDCDSCTMRRARSPPHRARRPDARPTGQHPAHSPATTCRQRHRHRQCRPPDLGAGSASLGSLQRARQSTTHTVGN